MTGIRLLRRALPVAVLLPLALLGGAPPAAAAPADPLHRVAEASERRLATAADVAAVKWATGTPVDDPAREGEVLARGRALAAGAGLDPAVAERVLADQIAASKTVQRALHRRWAVRPASRPATEPGGLAGVRGEIDAADRALVAALAAAGSQRDAPACAGRLAVRRTHVALERRLDGLRSRALAQSLASVCPGAGPRGTGVSAPG
ncbi:gamma subclass chorismate mutase AroQ [Streptomyces sp. MP131-18]|uniref:gamma subclass chorismate mutase AroQ n=1 Tax=Streptomyces sp. MP131-18 TaxID=1857892 RepID=UPI0009D2ACED|nr:gamma subclass chorismate mutase AroQ [Streptomyces sp. MP131-18]ONK09908.1 Secreted chorismate mutase precursor [Streptomyces sp. MP131-18]